LNKYFFGVQPATIIARLARLSKLREAVKQPGYNFRLPSPSEHEKDGKKMFAKVTDWGNQHDFMLGNLMLEEGYSKWDDMLNSTKWQRYIGRGMAYSKDTRFVSFLRDAFYRDPRIFLVYRASLIYSSFGTHL
jgi:hypothetical protein